MSDSDCAPSPATLTSRSLPAFRAPANTICQKKDVVSLTMTGIAGFVVRSRGVGLEGSAVIAGFVGAVAAGVVVAAVGIPVAVGTIVEAGVAVTRAASEPLFLSFNPANHINPTAKITTKTTRAATYTDGFCFVELWL